MNYKNNKIIVILMVVFMVTTIILGGYILYNGIDNDGEIDKLDNDTGGNTNSYSYSLSNRDNIQAIRNGYVEIIVDTEGVAYLSLIGNIDDIDDNQVKNNLNTIKKDFKDYSLDGYLNGYIGNDGVSTLNAYKLDTTNVLTVYFVNKGNGGAGYFVFVLEDGKLTYLNYDALLYNGIVSETGIEGIEGVVSIIQNTYTNTPYAVDINGLEISLYDYIK